MIKRQITPLKCSLPILVFAFAIPFLVSQSLAQPQSNQDSQSAIQLPRSSEVDMESGGPEAISGNPIPSIPNQGALRTEPPLQAIAQDPQLDRQLPGLNNSVSSDSPREGTPIILYAAIFLLALATAVSVAVSFYLYKWRRILLSSPHMLVPEALGEHLQAVGARVNENTKLTISGAHSVQALTKEVTKTHSEMLTAFMTLQSSLDEKDSEIRRLKKGYDAEIYRKFINRFIRVYQAVDDCLAGSDSDHEMLTQLKVLLQDAFEECGVEPFSPNLGADYRTFKGVADNPKTVSASTPDQAFQVAEVLEAGYRIRAGDGYEILIPAKVKIFVN